MIQLVRVILVKKVWFNTLNFGELTFRRFRDANRQPNMLFLPNLT